MPPDLVSRAAFPVPPATLFAAWIDGERHAAMTGAPAASVATPGGAFTAWDGYIRGIWLALEPGRRITMSWRTSDFPDTAPDARVEVVLEPRGEGTEVTLSQWDTPAGQVEGYVQGWQDFYWKPMRAHFG